jgi:hypothetical protein
MRADRKVVDRVLDRLRPHPCRVSEPQPHVPLTRYYRMLRNRRYRRGMRFLVVAAAWATLIVLLLPVRG